MITLNSEKGLISVENWDDITSRPGFVANLNPREHTLKAVIGQYQFKEKIPCGLSNCHTPHNKGYIVSTEGGAETNIGKDCGRAYFGIEFENHARKYERDLADYENRLALHRFSFQIETIRELVHELRSGERGGDWCYKVAQPLHASNRGVPEIISRKIGAMLKAQQRVLSISRQATAAETEALEAVEGRPVPRPHTIEDPIAEIRGLDALDPENNLKQLLVLKIEEIKEFEGKEIDSMSSKELRQWAKWADTFDEALEKAQTAIVAHRALLTPENLEPSDIANFDAYLGRLTEPRGIPSGSRS